MKNSPKVFRLGPIPQERLLEWCLDGDYTCNQSPIIANKFPAFSLTQQTAKPSISTCFIQSITITPGWNNPTFRPRANMVSPENTNWFFDYGGLMDDIPGPDGNFPISSSGFTWCAQPLNVSSSSNVEIDGSFEDSEGLKESGLKKRVRSESCMASSSKACREKLRRDRLNDRFVELGSILEPGRSPKTDKSAILMDAVRMVKQLRGEALKLKDSNSSLQEKIKELKVEKNELREEKQRLKAEKEKLEQQLKTMNTQPGFLPTPIPAAFAPQAQGPGNKLMPFMGYPGVAMWQFMPPAAVDTSQDHVLRPPVA